MSTEYSVYDEIRMNLRRRNYVLTSSNSRNDFLLCNAQTGCFG
jgi:hypothetical protein